MGQIQRNPKISIIVPIYKVEKYLNECVDSILNQTFTDFELILVDDGSPDNCPKMCDAYARQDDRIRVIHQKNKGLSAARNAGIEMARGQWLGFIDSDDFVAPDFYEKLLSAAEAAAADCAICSIQLTQEDGRLLQTPAEMCIKDGVCTGKDVLNTIAIRVNTPYAVAWNKIYRRDVFKTMRYPEGRANEDQFVFGELFSTVKTVAQVKEQLYYYRQREGSIMRSRCTVRNLDSMWCFVSCYEYFEAHGESDLLAETEKKIFAKLTNVYYQLSREERRSEAVKEAKRKQFEVAKTLHRQRILSARAMLRTVLFQFFPDIYGIRKRHFK